MTTPMSARAAKVDRFADEEVRLLGARHLEGVLQRDAQPRHPAETGVQQDEEADDPRGRL